MSFGSHSFGSASFGSSRPGKTSVLEPEYTYGRAVLVSVDIDDVGGYSADWLHIGQQRGGSIGRGAVLVDTTRGATNKWHQQTAVSRIWNLTCDGALDPADEAWTHLLSRFDSGLHVFVQLDATSISGEKKEGKAWIEALDYEFPTNDAVVFSAEFLGSEELDDSPF